MQNPVCFCPLPVAAFVIVPEHEMLNNYFTRSIHLLIICREIKHRAILLRKLLDLDILMKDDRELIKGKQGVMSVTATELKNNLGKYLQLVSKEDIYITRNGKVVARLSNPYQDRVDIANALFGILSADKTLEESEEERLNQI